jgi:hypothetical protein
MGVKSLMLGVLGAVCMAVVTAMPAHSTDFVIIKKRHDGYGHHDGYGRHDRGDYFRWKRHHEWREDEHRHRDWDRGWGGNWDRDWPRSHFEGRHLDDRVFEGRHYFRYDGNRDYQRGYYGRRDYHGHKRRHHDGPTIYVPGIILRF